MKNGNSRMKVLVHFFIPYALLLLGFCVAGLFVYEKTIAIVEEETKEKAYTVLNQTKEMVDQRFAELEIIAMQVASGTKVRSFQYVDDPFRGTNTYRMLEMKSDLYNYPLVNHFIIDYFVVYINSEMVLSPTISYTFKQFYDLKFQYHNIEYEVWRKEYMRPYFEKAYIPQMASTYNGKEQSIVTYIHPTGGYNSDSFVLMFIDNTQIHNMLRQLDSSDGGYAYIVDQSGQVISQTGEAATDHLITGSQEAFTNAVLNGEEMLVTQTTSDYNGWSYISVQPESVLLLRVQIIKRIFFSIIFAVAGGGLIAALFFAYRNSRWLWMLLGILPKPHNVTDTASVRNTFNYIGHSVRSLIYNQELLMEKMDEQLPLLRSAFFNRLIRGEFASSKDIVVAMEHSRISWEERYTVVVIIQIAGFNNTYNEEILGELDVQKIGIREMLKQDYKRVIAVHDLDEQQMLLFVNGDAASAQLFLFQETTRVMLQELRDKLMQMLHIQTYIAIGGCYEELTDISRSYEEAQQLLQHMQWTEEESVACYGDIRMTLQAYYYPPDVELRLISLVKSGNLQETKQLLEQIKSRNVNERWIPLSVRRILLSEIAGTLMKCCEQSSMDKAMLSDEMESALKAADPKQTLEMGLYLLGTGFLSLCRKHDERKRSHNDQLKDNLMNYLEQHYSNTELSLSLLAEVFQTSETYISYFFKEQTGINFSDYLVGLRMDHAKQLLVKTSLPIHEIALRSGYYSLNSFSRAFKRANGLSATEFRSEQGVVSQ